MGIRYKLSAVVLAFTPPAPAEVPPPADPAAKADIDVELVGIEGNAVTLRIPQYSLDTHNELVELRIPAVPGTDHLPTDVEGFKPYPFATANVAGMNNGTDVAVTLPDLPPIPHNCQVILGFRDDSVA